jgi:hypothetical protein
MVKIAPDVGDTEELYVRRGDGFWLIASGPRNVGFDETTLEDAAQRVPAILQLGKLERGRAAVKLGSDDWRFLPS